MKVTRKSELESLFESHFKKLIESVNRARRGEDMKGDYWDEHDGPGSAYSPRVHEGVNRARRSDDSEGDYSDEAEGPGVSYDESIDVSYEAFVRALESNLYTDRDVEKVGGKENISHGKGIKSDTHGDEDLEETNLYTDADEEGRPSKKKAKSHAAPEGHTGKYPGPPAGMASESRAPSLSTVFEEGYYGLNEVSPPGWEKTVEKMKGKKDIDNPFALAWSMHKRGAKPDKE